MFEEATSAVTEAESKTEETRSFIKQVRVASRRRYTPEEKVRIVLEGFRREVLIHTLYRREGIMPNVYYAWLRDFMESGKARLARDTVWDATRQEINEIKRESTDLKHMVADISLQVHLLKKTEVPGLE